jgi:DNA primase
MFTDARRYQAKGKQVKIDYLVRINEATLLWMVNLDSVEINPRNSRTTLPKRPDYIVIGDRVIFRILVLYTVNI